MNNTAWVAVGLGALALIAGGLLIFQNDGGVVADDVAQIVAPSPQPSEAPKIRYPVSEAETAIDTASPDEGEVEVAHSPTPAPLPALENSDTPLVAEATPLFGKGGLPDFLVPTALIEHFVVTVDNLDRHPIRLGFRPVRHVPGRPVVDGGGSEKSVRYLAAANTQRYAPYVRALEALDPAQVAALYRRYYPLFQQAYKNLGYPRGYFNDRLVEVVDHLLATPAVEYPIPVVQPKVFYQFADPALEDLSWGQKSLIRVGPSQMVTVKSFLRDLRVELTKP